MVFKQYAEEALWLKCSCHRSLGILFQEDGTTMEKLCAGPVEQSNLKPGKQE